MKYRGPNFYPPEGHDWIPTDGVRRLAVHNQAQLDEQYAHDVAAFRTRFFKLMFDHSALADNGTGWAVFDDDSSGNTLEQGSRDVLCLSERISPVRDVDDYQVPMIRIITNEPFLVADTEAFLTEEMTILPNTKANYFISAINISTNDRAAMEEAVKTSVSPIFIVRDGALSLTMNFQPATPQVKVTDRSVNNIAAIPFGDLDILGDREYALGKASDILASIADITPQWHSDP